MILDTITKKILKNIQIYKKTINIYVYKLNESINYILRRINTYSLSESDCLVCRHKYLTDRLISEEEYLVTRTLNEYADEYEFAFDEYYYDEAPTSTSINLSFYNYIIKNNYKWIILSSYDWRRPKHPSIRTIQRLKKKGVKIVALWFDTCSDSWINDTIDIIKLIDKHVIVDNPLMNLGPHSNYIKSRYKDKLDSYVWSVPSNMFDSDMEKDIDVTFLGRTSGYRDYRNTYIEFLLSNNIPLFYNRNDSLLSWEQYRNIISRSKIILDFSISIDKHQLKARTLHAFWSKSLLITTQNPQLVNNFIDGIDYISFKNKEDLLDKINYYRLNQNKREIIAQSGHDKVRINYNSISLWKDVFNKIGMAHEKK